MAEAGLKKKLGTYIEDPIFCKTLLYLDVKLSLLENVQKVGEMVLSLNLGVVRRGRPLTADKQSRPRR